MRDKEQQQEFDFENAFKHRPEPPIDKEDPDNEGLPPGERMIMVYVAGPYTRGNKDLNTKRAIQVAHVLWKAGFIPYVPHLTHFWDKQIPEQMSYDEWLEYDSYFLDCCQCLLWDRELIPGESKGAEAECAHAHAQDIPVFKSVHELFKAFPEDCRYVDSTEQAELLESISDMLGGEDEQDEEEYDNDDSD